MNGQETGTTQGQQTEQPKPFPMTDTDIFDSMQWSDVSFDEQTGRINMDFSKSKPPETPGIATATDQNTEESQPNQQTSQQSGDAERIAKLEGTVHQLINVVTQMAAIGNSNSLNPSQGEQPQYDLNDQGQLSLYIGDSINKALKPVLDILPKIVQRIEMQDSRAQYGKDYEEALPHFQELVAGGALTAKQAVELYKSIKGANGNQSANTHGANQNQAPKQTGTPEALISKANRVQTQTGMNGSVPSNTRQITNVRDAFEAALEQYQ